MKITKNIGRIDRIIRLAVGLLLVLWGLLTANWFGLIGLIPLATVVLNWCPLYTALGMNTLKPGE